LSIEDRRTGLASRQREQRDEEHELVEGGSHVVAGAPNGKKRRER